jgi:predicted nucleic acid-binding protein
MLVVADTSPIHYLILIEREAILPALYGQVAIPPAVLADLQQPRTPALVRAWVAHYPAWLEVRQPRQALDAAQFPQLGAGEREAIALAQELQASLLLFDDADGRAEAERRALIATGTLGILEAAAIQGQIDLPSALTRLQATTFRVKIVTTCTAIFHLAIMLSCLLQRQNPHSLHRASLPSTVWAYYTPMHLCHQGHPGPRRRQGYH